MSMVIIIFRCGLGIEMVRGPFDGWSETTSHYTQVQDIRCANSTEKRKKN